MQLSRVTLHSFSIAFPTRPHDHNTNNNNPEKMLRTTLSTRAPGR
jgi:hypothetical protein